jgi:hypothetical protein
MAARIVRAKPAVNDPAAVSAGYCAAPVTCRLAYVA